MENKKTKRLVITALSILFSAALAKRAIEGEDDKPRSKPPLKETGATAPDKSAKETQVDVRHLNWPDAILPDVLSFSPFGRPQKHKVETATSPTDALAQIHGQAKAKEQVEADEAATEVRFVGTYTHAGKIIALVDSRIVEVGDRLDDGSLVMEISDRKILVRPIPEFADQSSFE